LDAHRVDEYTDLQVRRSQLTLLSLCSLIFSVQLLLGADSSGLFFLTQQSQLCRRFCPEFEDWLPAQQIMRSILNAVKDLHKKDWINTNLIDLTPSHF
jgi:hypothetical protein